MTVEMRRADCWWRRRCWWIIKIIEKKSIFSL